MPFGCFWWRHCILVVVVGLDCTAAAAIDLHWRLCEFWRLQVAATAGRGRGRALGGLGARTRHAEHGTVFAQIRVVIDAILIDPFHLFMLDRRLHDGASVSPAYTATGRE